MDWRRGCAELMLLRGLCDKASSWWFFRARDGRGQSGIDRSGSFADVGSPPRRPRPGPSAAGVKLGRVIAGHRAAVRELKSLRLRENHGVAQMQLICRMFVNIWQNSRPTL